MIKSNNPLLPHNLIPAKPANGRASFVAARSRGRCSTLHHNAPRVAVRTRIGIVSSPFHRDPSRWTTLRGQMERILSEHASAGGEAVSLLAADSDRLFASVALSKAMRLQVVIPCQGFEDLFATPDDVSEYLYLRAAAHSRIVLDRPRFSLEAFEVAAKHIVDTCDFLVAIGSGKPPNGRCSTGSIVHYASEQSKLLAWLDPEAPVMSPRLSLMR